MVQHQITYEVQPESTTTVRLLSTGKIQTYDDTIVAGILKESI